MNIYKETKEIAKKNSQIQVLADKLSEKIDTEGICWDTATLVSLSKEDIEYFQHSNGVTEDYFVAQSTGYCEDDYYGYLYFKTNVPGQYVKVYFSM